jgi:hypothetical protein
MGLWAREDKRVSLLRSSRRRLRRSADGKQAAGQQDLGCEACKRGRPWAGRRASCRQAVADGWSVVTAHACHICQGTGSARPHAAAAAARAFCTCAERRDVADAVGQRFPSIFGADHHPTPRHTVNESPEIPHNSPMFEVSCARHRSRGPERPPIASARPILNPFCLYI